MSKPLSNAQVIERELAWLQEIITIYVKISFDQTSPTEDLKAMLPPEVKGANSAYANFVDELNLNAAERLTLILALAPHVMPHALDFLNSKNQIYDVPFTEFGGVAKSGYRGILPTGETVMFLLGGSNIAKRLDLLYLFDTKHAFYQKSILSLVPTGPDLPHMSGVLTLAPEIVEQLTIGAHQSPRRSESFLAKRISTDLDWEDIVFPQHMLDGIHEIESYIKHGKRLKQDFSIGKKIAPGFRALFTGPSGTGKTITAKLLGKTFNKDVYKIDLSRVVSKFIGETEKNLSRVFDLATSKGWILFFDEADALFGKRTSVNDSHDRYANQEVSYLLQRIEDHDGLIILSSNWKNNIDEAFYRRFQIVLQFELPDARHRSILWNKFITNEFKYDKDVDIDQIANHYELSAGSIVGILHKAMLKSLDREDKIITSTDLRVLIRRELTLQGRIIKP